MAQKNEKSFENELCEVKEIVTKLSNPEITLSESVKLYKDGLEKLKNASKILESAKLEIEEYAAK
jgi:exodeoxyribonuclease VII small subunit